VWSGASGRRSVFRTPHQRIERFDDAYRALRPEGYEVSKKIEREERSREFRLGSHGLRAGIGLIAASAALAFSVLVFGPVSDQEAMKLAHGSQVAPSNLGEGDVALAEAPKSLAGRRASIARDDAPLRAAAALQASDDRPSR
jgi:hypothetical protein